MAARRGARHDDRRGALRPLAELAAPVPRRRVARGRLRLVRRPLERQGAFHRRALVGLAIAIATVCGLAYRRRQPPASLPDHGLLHGGERLSRAVSGLLVAVPVIVVALLAAPNLRLYIGPAPQYAPSFDANNFLFSEYLVQTTHLEPVKDFFWLYGFQWLFDKAPPWGLLISYGWSLLLWAFLALGTYLSLSRFFSGRSLLARYLVLCGFWLSAALTPDLPFTTRYIASLGTVLMFAGIDRDHTMVVVEADPVCALPLQLLTVRAGTGPLRPCSDRLPRRLRVRHGGDQEARRPRPVGGQDRGHGGRAACGSRSVLCSRRHLGSDVLVLQGVDARVVGLCLPRVRSTPGSPIQRRWNRSSSGPYP